MKTRQVNDLHLEFSDYEIPVLEDDANTVLVIAGDLSPTTAKFRIRMFFERVSKRFRAVIFVLGNHDYWRSSILRAPQKYKEIVAHLDNVHVLQNETKVIDNVAFIGGTLWTNYNNDPLNEALAFEGMVDFRKIRVGPAHKPWERKLKAEDLAFEYYQTRGYIEQEAAKQKADGKIVYVVTHHAPSPQSVHPMYIGDPLNTAYYSNLNYFLEEGTIDYWGHGHVHWQFDYVVGHCRVMCRPRGYHDHIDNEYTGFNDKLVVEMI